MMSDDMSWDSDSVASEAESEEPQASQLSSSSSVDEASQTYPDTPPPGFDAELSQPIGDSPFIVAQPSCTPTGQSAASSRQSPQPPSPPVVPTTQASDHLPNYYSLYPAAPKRQHVLLKRLSNGGEQLPEIIVTGPYDSANDGVCSPGAGDEPTPSYPPPPYRPPSDPRRLSELGLVRQSPSSHRAGRASPVSSEDGENAVELDNVGFEIDHLEEEAAVSSAVVQVRLAHPPRNTDGILLADGQAPIQQHQLDRSDECLLCWESVEAECCSECTARCCCGLFFSITAHTCLVLSVAVLLCYLPHHGDSPEHTEDSLRHESELKVFASGACLGLAYITIMIEAYCSGMMQSLGELLSVEQAKAYIKKQRQAVPTVTWHLECFHYEVITEYHGTVHFTETFGFLDQVTKAQYMWEKQEMINSNRHRDQCVEVRETFSLRHPRDHVKFGQTRLSRCLAKSGGFVFFTAILLTWPYRFFFRYNTNNRVYTFVKLVGR